MVGEGFARKNDLRGISAQATAPLALPDGQRNAERTKGLQTLSNQVTDTLQPSRVE
jgi:hypothetical protein